jgi:hypothetical protein
MFVAFIPTLWFARVQLLFPPSLFRVIFTPLPFSGELPSREIYQKMGRNGLLALCMGAGPHLARIPAPNLWSRCGMEAKQVDMFHSTILFEGSFSTQHEPCLSLSVFSSPIDSAAFLLAKKKSTKKCSVRISNLNHFFCVNLVVSSRRTGANVLPRSGRWAVIRCFDRPRPCDSLWAGMDATRPCPERADGRQSPISPFFVDSYIFFLRQILRQLGNKYAAL